MTTEELAVPRPAESAPKQVVACAFCRRRLADEYYLTCIKCEACYCYIHMSRHQPASCARQIGKIRRAVKTAASRRQGEFVPLVLAGRNSGGSSSANV